MKTIRNQLKYPVGLRLPVFVKMGIMNCLFSVFMRLQETTNRQHFGDVSRNRRTKNIYI